MTKPAKIVLSICVALLVLLAIAFSLEYFVFQVPLFDRSGWDKTEVGAVRYLDYYGRPLKQWQTIDGKQYYFDPDSCVAVTGWLDTAEGRCYFSEDGVLYKGWLPLEGEQYYLDGSGYMHIGWLDAEGLRYYFDPEGTMHTGWLELDSKRFYFDATGVMQTGWLETPEGRFYLSDDGALDPNWQQKEDGMYYLTEEGQPYTGWREQTEGKYYFDETGKMQTGWQELDGAKYFFDDTGCMQTGWITFEEKQYYLDAEGKMLTGWQDIDGMRCYFDDSGVRKIGWITDTAGRFYLYEDGTYATGFVEIDGIKRYFTSTGEYIILANRWNYIPDDYETNLVSIGKFKMDASCAEALEQMMADCNAAGHNCQINSAYRSKATQQGLWDTRYEKYQAQGYTREQAAEIIGRSVAIPGTSEHQLGLAVDLKGTNAMYQWLAENSWKYGFILRYPDDKIDITGIIYEPWHFRYVGEAFAKDVYDSGLCLEEYLEKLEQQ